MKTKYMPRGEHCAAVGCLSKVHAKGLCNLHYRAELRPAKRTNPCGCGCGGVTQYRFLHGHHTRLFTSEEQTRRARQNTGDALRDTGSADWYRKVSNRHEHRTVAEQMLGRTLTKDEVVHHKNGNKKDNRPENLQVMSRAEHMTEHRQQLLEGRRANRKAA